MLRLLLSVLTGIAILSLAEASNSQVLAQSDLTPPVVVDIKVEPQLVYTSQSPQTLTVTVMITDDLSGLDFSHIRFKPESGANQTLLISISSGQSGVPAPGNVYMDIVTLPRYAAEGRWTISSIYTKDQAGNSAFVDDLEPYSQYFFTNTSTLEPNSIRMYLPIVVISRHNAPSYVLGNSEQCESNTDETYFSGFIRDSSNNRLNNVCVHIAFYEPRWTKCSGCDGAEDGAWLFSPFGGPAPTGVPIEIFVVSCEGDIPPGGQNSQTGFGSLIPLSEKWMRTITQTEQCTGITFYRLDNNKSNSFR